MEDLRTCSDCPKYILTFKGGYCLKENEAVRGSHIPCEWFYQNVPKN